MNNISDRTELIIGLVAPIGVNLQVVQNWISNYLSHFGYKTKTIILSDFIKNFNGIDTQLVRDNEGDRIDSFMTAGNEIRQKTGRNDIIAALAIGDIHRNRTGMEQPLPETANLLVSLKHPDEVELLRNTYGDGFYLLGITSSKSKRMGYLTGLKGVPPEKAQKLIERDESEEFEFGQHVRETFYLADGYFDINLADADKQIERIIHMIFGFPWCTPTRDEYAMFLAFSASLRSGDLSRQVGAVVTSAYGEVIATGANDVPRSGGGLYWPDDTPDNRDYNKGLDANEKCKNEIILKTMNKISPELSEEQALEKGEEIFHNTGLLDITEYGRAVHAEMEALLSCARAGVSPRDGSLYCTTFPCHNCAKHIIASGIRRVVFIEPYPKSRAMDLHHDDIFFVDNDIPGPDQYGKVGFESFVGIGPRRFVDLFSMTLSNGKVIKRKEKGRTWCWQPSCAGLKVPMKAISYIEQEKITFAELEELIGGNHGDN